MDPASVTIGVVSGAAALAALAVQVTTYLLGLKDTYKDSELIIMDLASTCQAFEIAWRRIHDWASSWIGIALETDSIFQYLIAYHETGNLVLRALNAELMKLAPTAKSAWRLSPRSKKSKLLVVLHQQGLKDHSDRINHQVNSLHLLLSTAQLSNHPKIQDVVLDLLQPVFRKDEESAWTVVKSGQSTKRPPASSVFTRSNYCAKADESTPIESKHFDFENELILGPVYKRVLFAHLCTLPLSNESSTRDTSQTRTTDPSLPQGSRSEGNRGVDMATNTEQDIDWSPENIVKILKHSGGFSVSVLADLNEVRDASDPSLLTTRSLPLGAVLKQNRMLPEAQKYQNAKLIMGAAMEDADFVAHALEDGAEINTISDDGRTALQMSLEMSPKSDIAALLLLYREANRNFRDTTGEPILLEAVRKGNIPLVRALVTNLEDLRVFDRNGDSILHVAVRSWHHGLEFLRELDRIFTHTNIDPDKYLDRCGRSALHAAVHERSQAHAVALLRLGSDPSLVPRPPKHRSDLEVIASPLYSAVKLGYVELVKTIIEESSAMPDIVNWQHHRHRSLLDCVKESGLAQRWPMAEILIAHGAKWNKTWKQPDHLLEFAIAGRSPRLLLLAVSKGCLPLLKSLDITELLPKLHKDISKEEAARVLYTLITSGNFDEDEVASRPTIFAWMAEEKSSSAFRETSSLRDILQDIIATGEAPHTSSNAALVHTTPNDPTLPLSITLSGNDESLGQLMYHMDRSLVDPSGRHQKAAKEKFLYMVGNDSAPGVGRAVRALSGGSVDLK